MNTMYLLQNVPQAPPLSPNSLSLEFILGLFHLLHMYKVLTQEIFPIQKFLKIQMFNFLCLRRDSL
jgi:hypothetical protein